MSPELLLAFIAFAFVSSVTPGPNNMMLLASGVNFGVRRTLPHIAGISLGHALMVLGLGLGLNQLFVRYPSFYLAMQVLGALYLLYLAWKIATAAAPDPAAGARGKPFGFFQAAAFQWVNPKAWVMAIGAITTFVPQQDFGRNILLVAGLFALVNLPSCSLWVVAGSLLRRALQDRLRLRLFNAGMAILLVLSLYPLLSRH